MLRTVLTTLIFAAAVTIQAGAQERGEQQPTPKPAETAPPARAAEPREPSGQPVNVKLELTITDQAGPGEPSKKVITMIVADRQSGFIRSKATVLGAAGRWRDVTINVDARPTILREGSIRVELGLEYQPTLPVDKPAGPAAIESRDPGGSNLNQRIGVIVDAGKPLLVSQAADPASDRRIAVELRATILK